MSNCFSRPTCVAIRTTVANGENSDSGAVDDILCDTLSGRKVMIRANEVDSTTRMHNGTLR